MQNGQSPDTADGRRSAIELQARVAAVVVTFNPEGAVFAEMMAALAATGVHLVVVVDNGSGNARQIGAFVGGFGPGGIYLPQPANLGIAAAQNLGLTRARSEGCSHVMLFDQDTVVPPHLVRALLADEARLLQTGVKVGVIGPCFSDSRSGSLYPQARIAGPFLRKIWLRQGTCDPVEVSFIIASGSLIQTAVLTAIGAMNEAFFIDKVDIEWCLRARAHGYSAFISPRAVMAHSIGDRRVRLLGREISIHSALRRYYMARNSFLLARQPWVPGGYRLRELFCVLFRTPFFLLAVRFNRNYLKHISMGILHGVLGRGGQYGP
jgi:rhamnosyltransferase